MTVIRISASTFLDQNKLNAFGFILTIYKWRSSRFIDSSAVLS